MSLWMKSYGVTIQMKATEQYFPVVLFIMLYKVVLTSESLDEILWCDHSNESYRVVLSYGTVIMPYKAALPFESVKAILQCDYTIKIKPLRHYFHRLLNFSAFYISKFIIFLEF